ncbi:hypothetical protein I5I61_18805 [Pseudomonas nitroreducens]|uniref:TMhelix containing protein n=1 Tax=Pseudomonas nitroreducens TaxID=46680 RepID=A0ABS0KNJ1_PSENT|nr:hypothetical protein [Pseudomonas nitroreducens]MBG6289509.1 hypothetical protein [Pseudomonas nitroreducens]
MSDLEGFLIGVFLVFFMTWLFTSPRIYPESVEFAASVCSANDGWAYIKEGRSQNAVVKCKNGAEFEYKWDQLGAKK